MVWEGWIMQYGEQKIARFRTHYLTNELAYVSTQNQANFNARWNDLKEMGKT